MKDKYSSLSYTAPEHQLNQIAKHTIPQGGWFWLSLLVLLMGALLLWAFIGHLQVNISGKGIILNQSGIFSIQTPFKGIVRTLYAKPGDTIQAGGLIAEIYDAQREMLLQSTKIKIDALQEEVNRLRNQLETESEASKRSLEAQLASLNFNVKTLDERVEFLGGELKKKQKLYQEGLIILNVVQETERQISETKIAIEGKKSEIADTQFKLQKSYRTEELKTKELDLLKAQGEATVVQAQLEQNHIRSGAAGKVLEILVNLGEVVNEGQALVNVEFLSSQNQFIFYGYIPAELGKHIQKGNLMHMALSTVNEKEYGAIQSRVQEVSDYAVSEKAIVNLIHNTNLAHFLSNRQPVIQVIATPILDLQDPSGYAWTSGKGPPLQLSTGIVGTVEVTVENIHPIYYLIPLKQFKQTPFDEEL